MSDESDACLCVLSGRYSVNIYADESRRMGKACWSCLFLKRITVRASDFAFNREQFPETSLLLMVVLEKKVCRGALPP